MRIRLQERVRNPGELKVVSGFLTEVFSGIEVEFSKVAVDEGWVFLDGVRGRDIQVALSLLEKMLLIPTKVGKFVLARGFVSGEDSHFLIISVGPQRTIRIPKSQIPQDYLAILQPLFDHRDLTPLDVYVELNKETGILCNKWLESWRRRLAMGAAILVRGCARRYLQKILKNANITHLVLYVERLSPIRHVVYLKVGVKAPRIREIILRAAPELEALALVKTAGVVGRPGFEPGPSPRKGEILTS